MLENFKFSKITAIVLAVALTVGGGSLMTLISLTNGSLKTIKNVVKAEEEDALTLPGAGMGGVIKKYISATNKSSVELLSTTALGLSAQGENPYYDKNGNVIGKLIVYNGTETADVYDKIPGTERKETGDAAAKVIGHMSTGSVATLVREQNDYYQIISDTVCGFVKTKNFVKGVAAERMDASTFLRAAYAGGDSVGLYDNAAADATLICVLPKVIPYPVVEAGETYTKISVDGVGEGWVLTSEMVVTSIRKYALSLTEEASRLERVAAGLQEADDINSGRAAEEQAQREREERAAMLASILPAAPDSADVAALRAAIAGYAQQFVGVLPYVWGSADLNYGADCSGFTSAIYAAYGYYIPRDSNSQSWGGTSVSMSDLRPGDIIAYPGHVALYIGGDTVVHEPGDGHCAEYGSLYMMPIINVTRYIN